MKGLLVFKLIITKMLTKKYLTKLKIITFVFCIVIIFSILQSSTSVYGTSEFHVNLVMKVGGGGVRPDYGLFIAQYLREIGIDVEIKVEEWTAFMGTILLTHDFDLVILGLSGGSSIPDMREVYTENGQLNLFGLNTTIPYCQESEDLQNQALITSDFYERQIILQEWQQLMMDQIIPMLPLYSPRSYVATWANLVGYDARWGIANSLPYMEFIGYHEGQLSLEEFRIADADWERLNNLLFSDRASNLITDLYSEKIIGWSPDIAPLKTGLIVDWQEINSNHYKFFLRDNVFWNPSYNITDRDENSIPLDSISTNDLMTGLKDNQYSNGTNQMVTAKDVLFTLLCYANPVLYEDLETDHLRWLSDIYIDQVDPLAFHVLIDGDPNTSEIEMYVDFWVDLDLDILPEFFLNSSEPTITYTTGNVKCIGIFSDIVNTTEWISFTKSGFGCGKYLLDYTNDYETVLRASPHWFKFGVIDGTEQDLDIESFIIKKIPDLTSAFNEFKAGKLDLLEVARFYQELRSWDPHYQKIDIQSFLLNSFSFMGFNLRRPFIGGVDNSEFLTDEVVENYTKACAVRKAICYSIDRDEMNQLLHDGECLIVHSVLQPFYAYYYFNDIIKYDQDYDAARLWLSYAGYIEYETIVAIFPSVFIIFAVVTSVVLRKKFLKKIVQCERKLLS